MTKKKGILYFLKKKGLETNQREIKESETEKILNLKWCLSKKQEKYLDSMKIVPLSWIYPEDDDYHNISGEFEAIYRRLDEKIVLQFDENDFEEFNESTPVEKLKDEKMKIIFLNNSPILLNFGMGGESSLNRLMCSFNELKIGCFGQISLRIYSPIDFVSKFGKIRNCDSLKLQRRFNAFLRRILQHSINFVEQHTNSKDKFVQILKSWNNKESWILWLDQHEEIQSLYHAWFLEFGLEIGDLEKLIVTVREG